MTREKAIIHMTLRRDELKRSVGDLDEDIKAFDMAIQALEQTRWIPVSERLPEEYADVICCTDAEEVFMATYLGKRNDGSECFDDDHGTMCEGEVIAWRPLPLPYKEGEECINT